MPYGTIKLGTADGVATLTLARPDVLNAMNAEMVGEIRDAIARVRTADYTRALLITAEGRAFCSGADLNGDIFTPDESGGYGKAVAKALDDLFNPMILDLYRLEVPIVAAVNGVTAGGGVGLAFSADIVLAAQSASFVQVFGPRLGIVPDAGSSWHLSRQLGRARAMALSMLGERLDAETAREWGLIWRCVDDGALADEAASVARQLADGPTRAFPRIRNVVDGALSSPLEVHLDVECGHQRILCDSEDTREGIRAFKEKRTPVFKGR